MELHLDDTDNGCQELHTLLTGALGDAPQLRDCRHPDTLSSTGTSSRRAINCRRFCKESMLRNPPEVVHTEGYSMTSAGPTPRSMPRARRAQAQPQDDSGEKGRSALWPLLLAVHNERMTDPSDDPLSAPPVAPSQAALPGQSRPSGAAIAARSSD